MTRRGQWLVVAGVLALASTAALREAYRGQRPPWPVSLAMKAL